MGKPFAFVLLALVVYLIAYVIDNSISTAGELREAIHAVDAAAYEEMK